MIKKYSIEPMPLQLPLQFKFEDNQTSYTTKKTKYISREVEPKIDQFLSDPEVLVLRGPRQAGKTTLLKRLGQKLTKKYGSNQVFLFTFEDKIVKDQFTQNPKEFIKHYLAKENKPTFFLLDEVQYLKDGGQILKLIYDIFPQVKLIVTGSSSLDLNQLGQYLVGRAIYFEIYPFSFAEFLKIKDSKLFKTYQQNRFNFDQPKLVETIFIQELNQQLQEYLTFGGYPRVVLESDLEKKQVLLRNIYSTYVEKDVASLFGAKYKSNLIDVLRYLGSSLGQIIQYQDICQAVSISHHRLKQTLDILEQTYLIKKIKPYHKNQVTELKKNPKYYFYDLGMRNVLLGRFEFEREEYGHLLENFVMKSLLQYDVKYWRTTAKAEVDFVLSREQVPIEVKTQAKTSRSLHSFIKTYQPKFGVITDLERAEITKLDKTKLYTVPVGLI